MLLEKPETVQPLDAKGFSISRTSVLYALGTLALIATVFSLLKADEPPDYTPQLGALEARR